MQKQEIIFPQLWSESPDLGSSNLVEMKLWEGTFYFFCVPKEMYDWYLPSECSPQWNGDSGPENEQLYKVGSYLHAFL